MQSSPRTPRNLNHRQQNLIAKQHTGTFEHSTAAYDLCYYEHCQMQSSVPFNEPLDSTFSSSGPSIVKVEQDTVALHPESFVFAPFSPPPAFLPPPPHARHFTAHQIAIPRGPSRKRANTVNTLNRRLRSIQRSRSIGIRQSPSNLPESQDVMHQAVSYTLWPGQDPSIEQSQAMQSALSPRRSSDGDQFPPNYNYARDFDSPGIARSRSDPRSQSLHSSPGSSSLSGAVGPIAGALSSGPASTPSPSSDASASLQMSADTQTPWGETVGLVAPVIQHGNGSFFPENAYNYLNATGQTSQHTPNIASYTMAQYPDGSRLVRSVHTPTGMPPARSMHTVPTQNYPGQTSPVVNPSQNMMDTVALYQTLPAETLIEELVRWRARAQDLEFQNQYLNQQVTDLRERRSMGMDYEGGSSSGSVNPSGLTTPVAGHGAPPASAMSREFRAGWKARTEARTKRFCSLNRAGNALCAWHDSRRERRAYPPRMAPPGHLNCGCTVEEALFEESLSRHGVGSYHPGETVRMDPALRNPLLALLQKRYSYQDGDFERDPMTGGWEEGEGPDRWENAPPPSRIRRADR